MRVLQKARIKIVARAICAYLVFFLYIRSPVLLKTKIVVVAVFHRKLDHCSIVYITRLF